MKRLAAFALCVAAAWLIYETGMEMFIGWYSGVEWDISLRSWVTVAIQVVVNVAAAVLAWRAARSTPSRGAVAHPEVRHRIP